MLQKSPFSRLMVLILVIGLFATAAYAAHDLTCYEMIEPSADYVQADSVIAPKLGIANLGDEAELNFPVEFLVIDKEGLLGYENDTVFAETTRVEHIGPYPDSIEVELPEWTPEGRCCDGGWRGGPLVYYDLLGIAGLETDEDQANDTVRDSVTCLLSHDVGVTDIVIEPEPYEPPDYYPPGSDITITATVENFGYHMEHDVPVRCEIFDRDGDSLVYNNVQLISSLDWRGNPYENPYITEVTFPVWTTPSENRFRIEVRTEMEGDECSEDDDEWRYLGPCPVEEERTAPLIFRLEVLGTMAEDNCSIQFAVPHSSWVKLDVFDVNGRWVKSIANDIFEAGHYSCPWDCRDAAGRKVAAGVYLIRMEADEFDAVRKIVIMN